MTVPLPPHMAARIEASEAAEERARLVEEQDGAAGAADRARMAEVSAHHFEALTGHSPAEWEQARQAAAMAAGDRGYDPAAPLGSAAHPEVLVDGESVSVPPVVSRYRVPDADAVELSRAEELARWRSSPQAARLWAASEAARAYRLPVTHRTPVVSRPVLSRSSVPGRAVVLAARPGAGSARSAASRAAMVARLERLPFGGRAGRSW